MASNPPSYSFLLQLVAVVLFLVIALAIRGC